jgi:hypothetical protein
MAPSETDHETHLVVCPCCSTKLTIDAESGEVLHEERPPRQSLSWNAAVQAGARKQAEAEATFEKGIERVRNADDLLEKKFREALKHADKSDAPPPRIFDLD